MGCGEDGTLGRMGRSSDSPAPLDTDPTDPSMGHWLRAESTLRGEDAEKRQRFPGKFASEKELLSITGEKRKDAIRNFPTVTRTMSKPTAKQARSTEP